MTEKITFIPARLKSGVVNGHVAGASDIIDDAKGKTQDTINQEVDGAIEEIRQAIGDEESAASIKGRVKSLEDKVGEGTVDARIQSAKDELNQVITANKQDADSKIDAIKGGSDRSISQLEADIATKQDRLTFDSAPELGSINPVESNGIKAALNEKQDNLEFENVPSEGSTKMVYSGGIKTYVDTNILSEETRAKGTEQELRESITETASDFTSRLNSEESRAKAAEKQNADNIADIASKIPSEATPQNQLADKNFVNSSVATETANYISKDGEPFSSLEELNAYSGPLTNNDYAFVKTNDAVGNTIYKRYKYSTASGTWALEYELNNSSFTAAQWEAINSGITQSLKGKLVTLPTAEELTALLAGKQNVIEDLATIRENALIGSKAYQKPSEGIPSTEMTVSVQQSLAKADTALQEHQSLENYYTKFQTDGLLANKQDNIEDLSEIREGASKGMTAIQEHQSLADYYNKSQVDSKLSGKQDTIEDLAAIRDGAAKGATAIQEHQSLDNYYTKGQVDTSLSGKQDVISDLEEIRQGAAKGATAIQEHQSLADYYNRGQVDNMLSEKQDKLTIDDVPTEASPNPISSNAVYELQERVEGEISGKQDTLTFDNAPTAGSNNPVTSDGILNALASLQSVEFVDVQVLPTPSEETLRKIYLLSSPEDPNVSLWYVTTYDEATGTYSWKLVNTNSIDLSDYYNKSAVDSMLNTKQDVLDFATSSECISAANELT